jgi:HSP20 family molecular chaperone IbpA
MLKFFFAFVFPFILAAPARAAQEPEVDSEQMSQDLIKNIDGWLGQVNEKLQSDKPVDSEDFDSLFPDSFFSDSEDPIREIELVQKKMDSKLGAKQRNFDESYGKWVSGKMYPADLSPEVVSDDRHVTVNLKTLGTERKSMKVKMDRKRIKLNYTREEKRQVTNPDGSVSSVSSMKKRQGVLPIPAGANPDKYRVRTSKGLVSIIFNRSNQDSKHAETSK